MRPALLTSANELGRWLRSCQGATRASCGRASTPCGTAGWPSGSAAPQGPARAVKSVSCPKPASKHSRSLRHTLKALERSSARGAARACGARTRSAASAASSQKEARSSSARSSGSWLRRPSATTPYELGCREGEAMQGRGQDRKETEGRKGRAREQGALRDLRDRRAGTLTATRGGRHGPGVPAAGRPGPTAGRPARDLLVGDSPFYTCTVCAAMKRARQKGQEPAPQPVSCGGARLGPPLRPLGRWARPCTRALQPPPPPCA